MRTENNDSFLLKLADNILLENMEFIYLQEQDIEAPEYISFYEKFHGVGSFQKRKARIHWYFQSEGYRLLVVLVDGKYVGQSCAYKVTAIVEGKEQEWWWDVDGFVLEEMRGKGIGKALQRKLHEDCPNFSSASYSATNGIIKRKVGGHELLGYHQYYCPVSCYFTLYTELVLKKLVNRKLSVPRFKLPYLFGKLNGTRPAAGYAIRELTQADYNGELSDFIEAGLADYSFHIRRSASYLRWKYVENPSIDYVGLEVTRERRREAVVFFTRAYNGKFTISKVRICKILDAVIKSGSVLTHKELLLTVIKYFKDSGIQLDGIKTLIPSSYWPQIQYPASRPFFMLSTYGASKLPDGYLALSDQDMEQMYENE